VMNSRPLERSSDLLASARGHMLIDELKLHCPDALIVFDLPPLLATDDALVVAPMVDALLFVVAEGGAKRDEVTAARQLVQEFNVIGTLLNKSVEQDSRAYYYY
jgi:protein-tyrosine kinase